MVDKLILLSPHINRRFKKIARKHGKGAGGYAHVVDLRETKYRIPALLYYSGYYNGFHKLEFVSVAKLGLRQVLTIAEAVCGRIKHVRIYRIDACVDIPDTNVEFFVSNLRISGVQNYKIYRSRGAISYYPQTSAGRTIVIYDKRAELISKDSPDAPTQRLTRIEVQLKGAGVPFKSLDQIHKYAEIKFLTNVRWLKLRTEPDSHKPLYFLAQTGLRFLVKRYGLQRVSKMFTPQVWASVKNKFFERMTKTERPKLNFLLKKGVKTWLELIPDHKLQYSLPPNKGQTKKNTTAA